MGWIDDLLSRKTRTFPRVPIPPENVRAVLQDGREIPLECVYVGVRDGLATWEAVVVLPVDVRAGGSVSVLADAIPPRTTIVVGLAGDA